MKSYLLILLLGLTPVLGLSRCVTSLASVLNFRALFSKTQFDPQWDAAAIHVGDVVNVSFEKADKSRVEFTQAKVIFEDQWTFTVQDSKTGTLQVVRRSSDNALKGRRLSKGPTLTFDKSYIHEDDVLTELQTHSGENYFVELYDENGSRGYLVEKASAAKTPYGADYIKITTINGVTHELDLSITNFRLTRIKEGDPHEVWNPKLQPAQSRNTLDPRGVSRRALSEKLAQAQGSPFGEKSLYDYFENNKNEIPELLNRWYGTSKLKEKPEVKTLFFNFEKAQEIFPTRIAALFLDPGIANRSTEFLNFARGHLARNPQVSSIEMRQAFSKHLGTRKVYRALLLDAKTASAIQKNGMGSTSQLNGSTSANLLYRLFSTQSTKREIIEQGTPSYAMEYRNGHVAQNGNSLLFSHSIYPDVAASAAYHSYSGNAQDPKLKTFLYELEIPLIDIMEESGIFSKKQNQGGATLFKVGNKGYKADDPGIEVFSWLQVPASQIKSYREVKEVPPPYKFE